jgi:hypothetical protein
MNKINTQILQQTLSTASHSDLEPARWLIVLVPCLEADLSTATRRVWELANSSSGRVLFIGMYENTKQELTLRRQMAGMAAMVSNAGIYTETEIVFGNDWGKAIRSRSHAGDMVACLEDHQVGPMRRPLSMILQSTLDIPLYILSSSYVQKDARFKWGSQLLVWSGYIFTLLGFFLLQIRIDKLTSGWIQTTLMLVSVALELWMIWVWNSLFE